MVKDSITRRVTADMVGNLGPVFTKTAIIALKTHAAIEIRTQRRARQKLDDGILTTNPLTTT